MSAKIDLRHRIGDLYVVCMSLMMSDERDAYQMHLVECALRLFSENRLGGVAATDDPPEAGKSYRNEYVDTLPIPRRAVIRLKAANIYFIRDLLECTQADLLAMPDIGPTFTNDIQSALAAHGLSLRER